MLPHWSIRTSIRPLILRPFVAKRNYDSSKALNSLDWGAHFLTPWLRQKVATKTGSSSQAKAFVNLLRKSSEKRHLCRTETRSCLLARPLLSLHNVDEPMIGFQRHSESWEACQAALTCRFMNDVRIGTRRKRMQLDESSRLSETRLSTQSGQRHICRRAIGMTPLATLKLPQL
jgi:hypothetical protein